MVDPNHPGGQYGVYPASPAGENMLMVGLAGSLLPLLPMRSIPSVFKKELSPKELLRRLRIKKQLDRTEPRMYPPPRPDTFIPHHIKHILKPQLGGRRGTRFPDSSGKQKFRQARTTLGDLEREYLKR